MSESTYVKVFEQLLQLKDDIRKLADERHQLQVDLNSSLHRLDLQVAALNQQNSETTRRLAEIVSGMDKKVERLESMDERLRETQDNFHNLLVELASKTGQSININQRLGNDTQIDQIDRVDGDIVGGDKETT